MKTTLLCWKCTRVAAEIPPKIGFRSLCPHCSAALHSCVNCRHHALGKPNECVIPGTDYVRDREGVNFCEDFEPKINPEAPRSDALRKAKKLLGQEELNDKKDFNSLFKDEK